MPHTEAEIDYWVDRVHHRIWTRGQGQEPPPLHEIEKDEWTPYRKPETKTTKGLLLRNAECVLGKQAQLDNYRWYPSEYLSLYLRLQTREEALAEWIAPDPDTRTRIHANTLYRPAHMFADRNISYEWRRKRVDVLPQNRFSDYTPMPPATTKLTVQNCFAVSTAFIQKYISDLSMDASLIEFEPFHNLKGSVHVIVHHDYEKEDTPTGTPVSAFHIMRTMEYAFNFPLCVISTRDLKVAEFYAHHILEACLRLFSLNTHPDNMPMGGWTPTLLHNAGKYTMYYTSAGLSKKQLVFVRQRIAHELSKVCAYNAEYMFHFLETLEVKDDVIRALCHFDDNQTHVNLPLLKCYRKDDRLANFKTTNWIKMGEAFLRGARIGAHLYRNDRIESYVLPGVRYAVVLDRDTDTVRTTHPTGSA